MNLSSASAIDVRGLKRTERTCRYKLTRHPENMDLRLRLAWCLFLQALHRAGREQEAAAAAASGWDQALVGRNAQTLLDDCLHETFTTMHLSAEPQYRRDAEQLQALVRLTGASRAIVHAEDRATHVLTEIAEDVFPKHGAHAAPRRKL